MEDESREMGERVGATGPAGDSRDSITQQARVNGLTRLSLFLALPVYVMVRAVAVATQSALVFVASDALFMFWTLCLFYTLGRALGKAHNRSKWLLRIAAAALAMMGAVGLVSLFGSLDGFPIALIAGYCAVVLLHPVAVEWGLRLNAQPPGNGVGLHPDDER